MFKRWHRFASQSRRTRHITRRCVARVELSAHARAWRAWIACVFCRHPPAACVCAAVVAQLLCCPPLFPPTTERDGGGGGGYSRWSSCDASSRRHKARRRLSPRVTHTRTRALPCRPRCRVRTNRLVLVLGQTAMTLPRQHHTPVTTHTRCVTLRDDTHTLPRQHHTPVTTHTRCVALRDDTHTRCRDNTTLPRRRHLSLPATFDASFDSFPPSPEMPVTF